MPRGQLYINGYDAYTTWGISMDSTALSALMTPSPVKEFIEVKYRAKHGKSVIRSNPRLEERDVTLTFNLTAPSEAEFMTRYASFCEQLATGYLIIQTSFQPDVYYRFCYISCTQFSQYIREIAKFSLKLNEPNPDNRGETDNTL